MLGKNIKVYFSIIVIVISVSALESKGIETPSEKSNLSHTQWPNSLKVYIEEKLAQKLEDENSKWHWFPWHYPRTMLVEDVLEEVDCIQNSAESYPASILTVEQIRSGGFILYALMGLCSFTLLALVCNDYFLPCVEHICEDLNIAQDVAAATFMAVATSTPEFFVNLISTILAESDMGVGTIVGSALFNTLGVACVGSLAAIVPIKIDKRPVIRDCLIYLFNVAVLLAIVWDGDINWYEATLLVILYVLYFCLMFNSDKLFRAYDWFSDRSCTKTTVSEEKCCNGNGGGFDEKQNKITAEKIATGHHEENNNNEKSFADPVKIPKSLWRYPVEKPLANKIWWIWSWPEKLLLTCTIPSPKTQRKLYPGAFIICIVWIGAASYLVSWSLSVIGAAFLIPDSVTGMTFLALGGCVPEAISIFIMSRKGRGGIGVSNALGANTLAILFSLGVPWFIKCMIELAAGGDTKVVISSNGIGYIVGAIPVAVACLLIILTLSKYTLKTGAGFAFMICYFIVITYAILVEMGILFIDTLPPC